MNQVNSEIKKKIPFAKDICYCGNSKECYYKDICVRAMKVRGVIATSMFFSQNEKCNFYINKED